MLNDELFLNISLPEPLSQDEIMKYFEKMWAGDESVKDLIILYNTRLVISIILDKFRYHPFDKQDMLQEGLMALSNSIDTYNPTKGKFSTHAGNCVKNRLINYVRDETRVRNRNVKTISVETPFESESSSKGVFYLKDVLYAKDANVEEYVCNKELYSEIKRIIRMLPPRRRGIMEFYYGICGNGKHTSRSLSFVFGISHCMINNELRAGEEFIRTRLLSLGLVESIKKDKRKSKDRAKVEEYVSSTERLNSAYTKRQSLDEK